MNFIAVDASATAATFFNDKIGDMVVGTTPGRTDPSMLVQLYFTETANSNPGGHTIPEVSACTRSRSCRGPTPSATRSSRT